MSTYNGKTLKHTEKLYQLIKGCSKNMFDIIAIQKHRLQTESDIDTILKPEFTFYYFLVHCAQSKITLFIFSIIESEKETKDTQFVVSVVILSRVTSRVVISN